MGLFQFLGIVLLIMLACGLATWIIGKLVPDHPKIVDSIVWVLGVVIIVAILIQALGLAHDVALPKLR